LNNLFGLGWSSSPLKSSSETSSENKGSLLKLP
jgi:hypothetical protein